MYRRVEEARPAVNPRLLAVLQGQFSLAGRHVSHTSSAVRSQSEFASSPRRPFQKSGRDYSSVAPFHSRQVEDTPRERALSAEVFAPAFPAPDAVPPVSLTRHTPA